MNARLVCVYHDSISYLVQ